MSTRAWLIGGAVLGAWWWLASGKKPTRAPAARRVLLIGDSLGVGLRPLLAAYYRDAGVAFASSVEGATNARQWRYRIGPLVEAHKPDLVLVSLGTNDALSEILRPEFGANMYVICGSAPSARCLWLRAPNRTASMVQAGVQVLDPPPGVELQPDGIHPTAGGYATWASHVVG